MIAENVGLGAVDQCEERVEQLRDIRANGPDRTKKPVCQGVSSMRCVVQMAELTWGVLSDLFCVRGC